MRLTKRQKRLLNLVMDHDGANTHKLAQARGDKQAYESNLRDRLFKLADNGLIKCRERRGPRGQVVERTWHTLGACFHDVD